MRLILRLMIGLVAVLCGLAGCGGKAPPPRVIALWPEMKVETTQGTNRIEERGTPQRPNRMIRDVRHAKLIVRPAPAEKATSAAVVICPGGGYAGQAIDKEGYEVARWLNSIGVTAVILQYRLPRPEVTRDGTPLPLIDARRAMRVVRSRANEWNIDPQRIGIMGFSAGGHLASTVITSPGSAAPDAADPVERVSARPDFAILGYPVISMRDPLAHRGSRRRLLGETPEEAMIALYSSELHGTSQRPPTFIFVANDDRGVLPENSVRFFEALQNAGVPAELHRFEKGGHGFGMGDGESAQWPGLCEAWMKKQGLLEPRRRR